MRQRRKIVAWVLSLLATVAVLFGAATTAFAAVGAPEANKNLYANGDGTYTLSLSVTGQAESSSTTEVTKANVILVLDTSTSMVNNNTQYNGQTMSRLNAEKHVLTDDDGIIDSLLAQNVPGDPVKSDIIEVAIVNFGTRGTRAQDFTTNAATLKSTVNGLSASQGTNWQEGLMRAEEYADAIKTAQPNEEVYIIFLTDGEPTTHYNDYSVNINYAQEWAEADDNARTLVTDGYHFYGIFTWGSGNSSHYLSSLVQYAYTGSGNSNTPLDPAYAQYFTDATDTDALIEALNQITHDITESVGFTNVELEDGVTSMTTSNVKTSVSGDVTGVKYYRSGGSYGTADPKKGQYGTEWAEAPHATVNEDGEVDWNLGNLVLEDGVTYTCTFVVWPSQKSLDLVADLNNGIVNYDSLNDDEKSQISVSGGKYFLKTNTDYPTVTYSTVTTTTIDGVPTTVVSDPLTTTITNPDPVGLADDKLNALKDWDDTLDNSQREEIEDVTLYLKVDGKYYYIKEDGTPMGVTLDETTDWTETDYIAIAPGLMVTKDSPAYDPSAPHYTFDGTTWAMLETGHEYVFEEEASNIHFELTAYTHHPMIMGTDASGNPVIKDVVFTKDASGNITGIESVSDLGDNLSATNTLKPGINIQKKVVDDSGEEITACADPFKVTIYLVDEEGNALPTKTTADDQSYTIDYRIYYGENNPDKGDWNERWQSYGRSDHIYKTGTSFTETLYVGDVIRVVNVETDAVYRVEESDATGYELADTTYEITHGSADDYAEYESDATVSIDGEDYYPVEGNSAARVTLTNKCNYGELEITKTVVNQITSPDTTKFKFTVELKDATGEPIEGEFSYTIGETTGTIESGGTLELANGEKATISKIPAGATYTVTETAKSGYTTTVDGDKTNKATGTITVGDTATAAFTNTYSVTPVIVDPPVQKVITGTEDLYNKGNFTFEIANTAAPEGVNAPMPEITKITNSKDYELPNKPGFYEFGEIEFAVPGTYTYTVTESGSAPGVTNDSEATKTIEFTVTDGGNGTLNVSPATADAVFTFTNVYKEGELDITKTVVNADNPDDTTKFTFTVTFEDVAEGAEFSYTIGETTGTISSGGTIELGNGETAKITGIPAGASYTVAETPVDNYTMTSSSNTSGTIKADETVTASFENTHDTGNLVVTKTVAGAFTSVEDLPDDFTISINRADGTTYKTITKADLVAGNGSVKLTGVPAGSYTASESGAGIAGYDLATTGTGTTATVEKDTDGTIAITNTYTRQTGSLTVTKALAGDLTDLSALSDNFTITVKGPDGTTYKTITKADLVAGQGSVTLTDVPTGKYSADESGEVVSGYTVAKSTTGDATVTKGETATITITNTYTSAPTSTVITAKKVLNGATLAAGQFSFELSGDSLETPLTATNAADGTVTFDSVSFTAAGEYTFTITEVGGDKGYIDYSKASYTVTVVVEANEDGSLKVASKTGDGEAAVFTNTYSATGKVDPSVKKTLNGRELEEGEFSFELSGDSLEASLTATNAADGSVTFDTIEYTLEDVKADVEAGVATQNDDGTYTYTYTIEETSTDGSGVTVDTKSITLTVTLTDDGEGNLAAEPSYSDNGEFVNTYKASGEITFEGTKSLEGREMTDDDVFTFAIYEGETLVAECENDGTGKINYPTITYAIDGAEGIDDTGTHTYTVKETSTDGNGITVDTQTYTVTVEVSDNGDGTLSVTSDNATGIDFVNTYDADPITIVPNAKKQLENASLSEGQFSFQLLDSEGTVIDEAKNTALGQVAFSAITYELEDVGTHTYTIKEVDDGQEYITYDGTEVTLTVVVTDNGNGTLNADVSYSPENVFKNTYHKPEVGLEVTKTVTSKPANGSYYKAGETVSYKIVVTNTGEVALTDVKVADDLTDEKWTIDKLEAGASETFTTTYKVTDKDVKAGSVLNVATAEADNPVDPDKPLKDKDNKKVPTGSDKNPPKKKIIPQTNDITPTGAMATMTIFGVAAVTAGTVLQRRKRK